jgi:hypothetical protein
LICGDGIREELTAITEFLDRNTTLDLTFGLLELAIYGTEDGRRLVLPRVLAKTVTIRRQVFRVEGATVEALDDEDEAAVDRQPNASQIAYVQFWTDLAAAMTFDDANQTPITIAKAPNTTLRMPTPRAWITLYLAKSSGDAGVFLTFNRGELGDTLYARLLEDQAAINEELPRYTSWNSEGGKHTVVHSVPLPNIADDAERRMAIEWFAQTANQFVNAFRPRLARYLEDI